MEAKVSKSECELTLQSKYTKGLILWFLDIPRTDFQKPRAGTLRQKRPTVEAKETYYGGKRGLLQRQKRPTMEAKETCAWFATTLHRS